MVEKPPLLVGFLIKGKPKADHQRELTNSSKNWEFGNLGICVISECGATPGFNGSARATKTLLTAKRLRGQ